MRSILYGLLSALIISELLVLPAEGLRVRRQAENSTTASTETTTTTSTTEASSSTGTPTSSSTTTTVPTTTTSDTTTTTSTTTTATTTSTATTTTPTTTTPTTTTPTTTTPTTTTPTTTTSTTTTTTPTTTTPTSTTTTPTTTTTTPTTTTTTPTTTTTTPTTTTLTTTAAATTVANSATQTTTKTTTKAASITTARAATVTVTAAAGPADPKVKCNSLSAKNLESCCKNPRFDFFTKKQKMVCNKQKFNAALFSQTMEFSLHKLQSSKNNLIDFESDVTAKTLLPGSCMMECLFTNVKALSASGSVNVTVLSNYLAKNLNDEWGMVIAEAVSDCVADYDALETNRAERAVLRRKIPKECSRVPNLIMQCVLKNIYESCPQSSQIETDTCDKTRQRFSSCHPFATNRNDRPKKDKRRKFNFKIVREKTQLRNVKIG